MLVQPDAPTAVTGVGRVVTCSGAAPASVAPNAASSRAASATTADQGASAIMGGGVSVGKALC
jgi:hypothetical protein